MLQPLHRQKAQHHVLTDQNAYVRYGGVLGAAAQLVRSFDHKRPLPQLPEEPLIAELGRRHLGRSVLDQC